MTLTKKQILFLVGAAFILLGVFLLSRWNKLRDEDLYQDTEADPAEDSEEEQENIKTDDSKEEGTDKTV